MIESQVTSDHVKKLNNEKQIDKESKLVSPTKYGEVAFFYMPKLTVTSHCPQPSRPMLSAVTPIAGY